MEEGMMDTFHRAQCDIVALAKEHRQTWRDQHEAYWFARLVEEIGELGGALVDNHEGPVEWELAQISAICMNWLDMRYQQPLPPPPEATP